MSTLYRCHARVGYKPFGTEGLILFDEKQIQELNVKLKWQPNLAISNAQGAGAGGVFANILSQSTCSVTISDPYLSGLAWPALFDAAQLYTAGINAAANNILLPACKEGEDPVSDKCFKYADLDAKNIPLGNFAHLIVSLWYDVKGTSFGTDFYYRVSGMAISHGSKFPSVTIRGTEAQSVIFNQSLVNIGFDEGMSVDEALKKLAEEQGFQVSFCANTNKAPEAGFTPPEVITKDSIKTLPRSRRYTGVTPDEIAKKLVHSTGGNMLTQPLREWANRISVCTRGEVSQGCSVFYLGKGLYEQYEITAQPELTLIAKNAERGASVNNADRYVSATFAANTYIIDDIAPQLRKKALEKVDKKTFPGLFEDCGPSRCQGPTNSGYFWKGSGPAVINEKKSRINLYGVAPNGTKAISYLKGVVKEASESNGKIVIETAFGLRLCEDQGRKKCFARPILQESSNLSSVKVKMGDEVDVSQEIGSSTAEKKEFTRFVVVGHGGQWTTVDPQIVWKYAIPSESIPPPSQGGATDGAPSATPTNPNAPPPAPTLPPPPAGAGVIVGRVGSTGSSTGPHLHAQWEDRRFIDANQVREFVNVPGTVSSPYNDPNRSRHLGVDIAGNDRAPIELINGASVAEVVETKCTVENVRGDGCGGGFGNHVIINTPKGRMILAHLAPQSIPPNIAGLTASSGNGKVSPGIQGAPATTGLTMETEFKGVPRALRIIPGRTVLSFVTNYDEWLESGRSKDLDPGVWVPQRFKNWFVSECEYTWRKGDLRVGIEGVSAWGTRNIQVPTFRNYLDGMRKAGEVTLSSNYYDYIRSVGDLSWKLEDGKNSTEVFCAEAQDLSASLSRGSEDPAGSAGSGNPSSVTGSFPAANCKTGDPSQDEIIKALYSAGINTPNGFAGVLGNLQEESNFNPNIHNTPIQGFTCLSDSGAREKCYGIAQWGGSRKVKAVSRCGNTSTLQCQLEFMVEEIKSRGGGMVQKLNNAKSPGEAAVIWARDYEVSDIAFDSRRVKNAEAIVSRITCNVQA